MRPVQGIDIKKRWIELSMLFDRKGLLRIPWIRKDETGSPYEITGGAVLKENVRGVLIKAVVLMPGGVEGCIEAGQALLYTENLVAQAKYFAQQFGGIGVDDFKVFVKGGHHIIHLDELR